MVRDSELMLMTGNAHPELAQAISNELQIPLVPATVATFPDGETQVQIHKNVRENDVFVIQPTGNPTNQNLMEAGIMVDALKRASAGRITAVIPYFGYARQDRKAASRVPITAAFAVKIFETAGADRLLAVDLHADQIQGFTGLPFDNLYASKTLLEAVRGEVEDPVVVAPDVGAGKMARRFAHPMGADIAVVDKERVDPRTTKTGALIGQSVAGRNILLVDDIVATAGSMLNAAALLKDHGAEKIVAAATHGVLPGDAIDRIEASPLDKLLITDTLPTVRPSDKIVRVPISKLLAQAIYNIHQGESVSELF